jgi:hypothetical protein
VVVVAIVVGECSALPLIYVLIWVVSVLLTGPYNRAG